MADERMESIRQGIAAPEESRTGKQAEEARRRKLSESGVQTDGAMGGTSDAGTAGDEANEAANRNASEEEASRLHERFRDTGRD